MNPVPSTPLHVTPDWGHVLTETLGAVLAVAVGIALLVGAFTLLHEWRTASR